MLAAYTSSEKAKICTLELGKEAERKYRIAKKKYEDAIDNNTDNHIQTLYDELITSFNQLTIARAAQICQMNIAKELAHAYRKGDKDTPVDQWEAEKYDKLVAKLNAEIHGESDIKKIDRSLWSQFKNSIKENFRTNTIYTATGWYTAIRLFIIYINRTLANLEKYDMDKFHRFLPRWFAVFGLSYGVTLLADVTIALYSGLRPIREGEEKIPRLTRLKNAFGKGNRPFRIANDAVWLAINTIGFFLTSGLSAIVGFAGLCFDEMHECFKPAYRGYTHKLVADKIQVEIDHLKPGSEIGPLSKFFNASSGDLPKIEQMGINNNRLMEIDAQKQMLTHIQTQQKKQARSMLINGIRPVVGTTLILIGMFFVFFPPASIPAAALIGVGLTALGGAVFTGLFYRIGDMIRSKMQPKKEAFINIDDEKASIEKIMAQKNLEPANNAKKNPQEDLPPSHLVPFASDYSPGFFPPKPKKQQAYPLLPSEQLSHRCIII